MTSDCKRCCAVQAFLRMWRTPALLAAPFTNADGAALCNMQGDDDDEDGDGGEEYQEAGAGGDGGDDGEGEDEDVGEVRVQLSCCNTPSFGDGMHQPVSRTTATCHGRGPFSNAFCSCFGNAACISDSRPSAAVYEDRFNRALTF